MRGATRTTRRVPSRRLRLALAAAAAFPLLALAAPFLASSRPWIAGADGRPVVSAPVPYDPDAVALERRFVPPGRTHWLGTDELGRDVLARVIHGSRVSVGAGLLAALLAVAAGIGVGALAGLSGGLPDRAALFSIDVVQAVPPLVLVAAGAAFFPPGALTAPLLIGLTGWTGCARLVRADARRVRGDAFVESVRAAGGSWWRILARHVLPHASGPAIAAAPYVLADAVMTEAALSFLGLGVPPPTASWGRAIADARGSLSEGWWCAAAPAAALLLLLLSARAVGEALSSLESAEKS